MFIIEPQRQEKTVLIIRKGFKTFLKIVTGFDVSYIKAIDIRNHAFFFESILLCSPSCSWIPYIAQVVLELKIFLSQPLSTRIIGMHQHTQLVCDLI